MSVERVGGAVVFHCDKCPEVHEGESAEFNDEWSAAKRAGWVSFQFKREWFHYCPACAEEN